MSMTMTQKILAAKAGLTHVSPGQLIMAQVDLVMGNDITAPVAIDEFKKIGLASVFDPTKVALVPDHFVPNKDIKSAQQAKKMREFAKEYHILHYFEVGKAGIEHALLPEKGLVTAGDLVIGADSHTCTYGALSAFSTGVGSTDMAGAMATGTVWLKVPEAVSVVLKGKLRPYVSGKDVILYLIGQIGVEGARYQSLEFSGEGVGELSMDDRFTIANMAIEAGAKNGIFPVDDKTICYIKEHGEKLYTVFEADADAVYARTVTIDLADVPPVVACPSLPENTKPADTLSDIAIDQVVIGSCTNGRIEDLRAAAAILKGRTVAVRTLIFPATQAVYLQAMEEGLLKIFVEAGAVISAPTCGPCLGGHMGILAEGERCLSTTNRNFVGRMGHTKSEVYLASPAVAAAGAVTGYITDPNTLAERKDA